MTLTGDLLFVYIERTESSVLIGHTFCLIYSSCYISQAQDHSVHSLGIRSIQRLPIFRAASLSLTALFILFVRL